MRLKSHSSNKNWWIFKSIKMLLDNNSISSSSKCRVRMRMMMKTIMGINITTWWEQLSRLKRTNTKKIWKMKMVRMMNLIHLTVMLVVADLTSLRLMKVSSSKNTARAMSSRMMKTMMTRMMKRMKKKIISAAWTCSNSCSNSYNSNSNNLWWDSLINSKDRYNNSNFNSRTNKKTTMMRWMKKESMELKKVKRTKERWLKWMKSNCNSIYSTSNNSRCYTEDRHSMVKKKN